MRTIQYIGSADVREIKAADFTARGLASPTIKFNKGNSFQQSVPDDVAALLLALGSFEDVGGATFADLAGPANEIASAVFSGTFAIPAANTDVPGFQILVPANSGPVELEVVGGLLCNIVTGTNPANTAFQLAAFILDELNALIGYSQWRIYAGGAASQQWTNTLPLAKSIGNSPIDKTYRIQMNQTKVGTLGSTSTLYSSAAAFTDPVFRAIKRS